MIRSMTGFASVALDENGRTLGVTARSVNHRFLDLSLKLPAALAAVEPRLRALPGQRLARGRVEIFVSLETAAGAARQVALDEALLGAIAGAIDQAREKGLIEGALTASDVLRIPGVLDTGARPDPDAAADVAPLAERAVGAALDALVTMRETEGRFLRTDLDGRLATLGALVDDLEREGRLGQSALESRLRDRLAALPADLAADAAALAQEIVRLVARSDIDEEIVRLRGHFAHWRELVDGPEPCGRKLDFLVQEMNREVNTIGSKIEGGGATAIVIDAKAELERVREQVQNVE